MAGRECRSHDICQEPSAPSRHYAKRLAAILSLPVDAVNVKAKTGEKVGAIGRAEAIGCHVVVLIEK